jgi:hypothetical protein
MDSLTYHRERRRRLTNSLVWLLVGTLFIAVWAWPSGAKLQTADHIVFATCVTLALIISLIMTARTYAP